MAESRLLKPADLSLEVVVLLFAGMTMLILGLLLFPVYRGTLPYYENGLFGLILVVFALQILSMGKTPFGDIPRSATSVLCGAIVAGVGIITCFIPDLLGIAPRILLIVFFGTGGLVLFLQLLFRKDRYRLWRAYGGIFHHLTMSCAAIYLMQILIAILIFKPDLVTGPQMASAALVYGLLLIYLALVLQVITRRYPPAKATSSAAPGLSMDHATLLLMALFMILLGLLLVPVNLAVLPFSGSAQLGLLMVLFAIQMLTLGNTPIGAFPRVWLMILLGFVFGALGVVSCIIPNILLLPLTFLVGVLNMAGGISGIIRVTLPFWKKKKATGPIPATLLKIGSATLVMNILTILFGISMLVSNLIPGIILGVVLAANGCVLFYLLRQLISLEKGQ